MPDHGAIRVSETDALCRGIEVGRQVRIAQERLINILEVELEQALQRQRAIFNEARAEVCVGGYTGSYHNYRFRTFEDLERHYAEERRQQAEEGLSEQPEISVVRR